MISRLPLPLLFLLPAFASAFSALDRPRSGFLQDVLESKAADQKSCKPTGLIQDACCDFETVETVNDNLFNGLEELVATPFFRFHKVDLYRDCPFWQEDGTCMNEACGVATTDEEHIPEAWRSKKLGELKKADTAPGQLTGVGCDVDDSDFCVLEDEQDSDGLYVDLLENPERFTGYAGASSSRVWKAIYEENCFTPVPYIDPTLATSEGGTGFAPLSLTLGKGKAIGLGALGLGGARGWGDGEKKLIGSLAGPRDGGDEICLEKRVFYRLVSGLHASISIHICDEYLDQKTGTWAPDLQCFITRIAEHPERLQNVYFSYVVLLRALSKSGPQLLATLDETSRGPPSADGTTSTRKKLEQLIEVASGCPSTFDETSMFSGPSAQILKDEFKTHFRNVSRIMDCVGCDKCRLWGKLQVTGLGTALKLLFSAGAPTPSPFPPLADPPHAHVGEGELDTMSLSRGEVVAFINTLHRFSESLAAVEKFRVMWAQRGDADGGKKKAEAIDPIAKQAGKVAGVPPASVPSPASEVDSAIPAARPLPTGLGSHPQSSKRVSEPTKAAMGGVQSVLARLVELCRESWRSCFELVRDVGARWKVEL